MMRFPTSAALTIVTLGASLALLPRLAPALKGPRLAEVAALADFTPERTPLSPLTRHVEDTPQPVFHLRLKSAPPLLADSNGGLDYFYEALARTERREPGAITRVLHYGDSPTTADLITGDIRAMLQARFGDAGHGFVLLDKPWAWYHHRGTWLGGSGWQIFPATRSELKDGMFGLGGVNFTGDADARSSIKLDDPGQSHFDLYFLREPGGGAVEVLANRVEAASIATDGDQASPGFASFDVPGGASSLELRPDGPVRLFGITAEKPGPGVVYDSIGLNGASITVLSRRFNAAHWTAELQHRQPDLVTINYGTNEAGSAASFIDKQYEKELREAIRRVRAALPEASILVMSPMDRGHLTGPGDIETMDTIPRIVDLQRRVAADTGCGFFDTYAAMGGAGTMSRWYNAEPRLVFADFIHPYPAGGKIIAAIFVKQIESGLARYKLRRLRVDVALR